MNFKAGQCLAQNKNTPVGSRGINSKTLKQKIQTMTKVKIITNTSNEVEVTLPQFRKVSHKFSGETFYAYFSENASENIQISFDSKKRTQSILNYATLDGFFEKEESTEEKFIEAYANAEKHVNATLKWFLEPKIEKVPDSVINGLEKWNNDKKEPCATEED